MVRAPSSQTPIQVYAFVSFAGAFASLPNLPIVQPPSSHSLPASRRRQHSSSRGRMTACHPHFPRCAGALSLPPTTTRSFTVHRRPRAIDAGAPSGRLPGILSLSTATHGGTSGPARHLIRLVSPMLRAVVVPLRLSYTVGQQTRRWRRAVALPLPSTAGCTAVCCVANGRSDNTGGRRAGRCKRLRRPRRPSDTSAPNIVSGKVRALTLLGRGPKSLLL